jgi:hypothetical protein
VTPSTRRAAVRLAAALAAAAVAGLAGASPAAADPPQPTDYRSTIESVEPALEGAEIEVVGGDSFLELRVDEGHEAEVTGYDGEPYLRVRTDGTVERNRNSPATYLNEDRLGNAVPPASANPEAEPDWERVAGGGEYAWHDHRIHWMSNESPPGKGPGDIVQEWTVDLTVDGTPTTVSGRLVWEDPVSPWPWALLGLLGAAVVAGIGHVRARSGDSKGTSGGRLVGPIAAVVAAGIATVVGLGQWADAPPGSGASPLVVAVPLAGLVAGVAGIALRRSAAVARAASLAAAAAVLGWAALRLPVLWKPVLSTVLPANLDRAGTALAAGLALGAAAVVVLAAGLAGLPTARSRSTAPAAAES